MNEQLPPEEIVAENELICEKLLSWIKVLPKSPLPGINFLGWRRPTDGEQLPTPSFTTWAEAGLILDALRTHGLVGELHVLEQRTWFGIRWPVSDGYICDQRHDTGPAAIRAAALEYVRSLP